MAPRSMPSDVALHWADDNKGTALCSSVCPKQAG